VLPPASRSTVTLECAGPGTAANPQFDNEWEIDFRPGVTDFPCRDAVRGQVTGPVGASFYPERVAEPSGSSESPQTGVAAFFDLDKTIIASSSALAFSKPMLRHGLISRRAALKSAYAQLVFSLSGADEDRTERMRAEISALCAGWDVAQVSAIVNETLHDIVDPLVYAEAAELIASHKERGHDVIVLSAAGQEVVHPIAAMLGIGRSVATRMEIIDGRYSGEVEFYCYGEQKAVAAKQLASDHGYDLAACYAYTDSSTDVPLLEVVGNPHAVNPDRTLRRVATERDWPILTFTNPVSLRSRIPTPSATAVAFGVGIGAVAAGMTWYGLARRKREK
jgi:HAD superfamily hydrolase (TIGR01490 family)